MEAFLAFLDHVHGTLTKTNHNTPIMLMVSPQWTRPDLETVAQYIFERTKTPALCLIHSGVATQYGLRWPHMTVIDVGFEKVDVTCIYESRVVSYKNVGGVSAGGGKKDISGGEVFTRKLLTLLRDKGFSYDMAEQLKKSPICEVLQYAPDTLPLMELPTEGEDDQPALLPPVTTSDGPKTGEQGRQNPAKADGEGGGAEGENKEGDEDGVLDVANIVVSGNTREFLAKREKEKTKTGKKGKEKDASEAAGAKPTRLPNSKRARNTFHYEEIVQEDVTKPLLPAPEAAPAAAAAAVAPEEAEPKPAAEGASTEASGANPPTEPTADKEKNTGGDAESRDVEMADQSAQEQPAPDATIEPAEGEAAKPEENNDQKAEQQDKPAAPEGDAAASSSLVPPATDAELTITERQTKRLRRDIEIGLERFLFADRREIDRIVTAIYRAVQSIEDMYMRPACWDNLVFVGNGIRLRGLRDNILQTLQARHLIYPSSATMFTSELPSNLGTPSGTGSQTPTSSFASGAPHQLPTTSSVNPLLQAATTGAAGSSAAGQAAAAGGGAGGASGTAGSNAGDAVTSHHFHSQTPTSIKLAQLPTYLSEWTKNGFEESMFLGAQVAARLAFCIHNLDAQGVESQRLMSLSRVDYK